MKGLPLLALIACGGDEAPSAPPRAPTSRPLELRSLGLRVSAPAGAVAGNAPLTAGALITGPGLASTTVVEDAGPKTLDEELFNINELSPDEVQTELLADGWIVTYRTSGPRGAGYWLEARREIGGRALRCWTTAADAATRDTARELCLSLQG